MTLSIKTRSEGTKAQQKAEAIAFLAGRILAAKRAEKADRLATVNAAIQVAYQEGR